MNPRPAHQKPGLPPTSAPAQGWSLKLFALAFGGFLGLALLKFPNPPVVEHLITTPTNGWEWALTNWPVRFAYPLAILLGVAGAALVRWPARLPKWPALLPLAWFLWLLLSAGQSIDPKLSSLTMLHFSIGVGCFYLGLLVLGRLPQPGWLLAGLVGAVALVLAMGWEQHFGGLEDTRQRFWLYIYPEMKEPPPPELLKRMESSRIFSTLFYANSLAGVLLLLTPPILGWIADAKKQFTPGARWVLAGLVAVASLACLVWSGSKAGWLLAVGLAVLMLLRLPVRKQVKVAVVLALLLAGLTGFVVRYAVFFKRGAPSVVERFNYWNAALKNAATHPVLGTGPGTFGTVYRQLKPPEAEMARLTHNDYLQQASDSGIPAALLLLAVIVWVLLRSWPAGQGSWLEFGLWLGLAGFAAQSFVEFGFYVPATSWCWFGLAGWLMGRSAGSKPANAGLTTGVHAA
jgi:O-antigen ligase